MVEGDVPANGSLTYSLHLLGGQYFQVSIESPITQAALGVSGADGTLLVSPAASAKFWQGTLPNTQDYYFQVVSTGPASHVVVSFIAPAPLVFAPGGTSIVVEGSVEANQTQYYAIQAQAGQLMQVMLDSPNQGVLLTIYGIQDGQPLNETKKWLWF